MPNLSANGAAAFPELKLPELNKDDIKAIRSSLPGKLPGRISALLSPIILVLLLATQLKQGLHEFLDDTRSLWGTVAVVALIALVELIWLFRESRANRDHRELRELAVAVVRQEPGYFRIGPYLDSPQDRQRFSRPDRAEERVLNWLAKCNSAPLYLMGDSGCGKSSLLNAFALPKMREEGWTIIETRVTQNPEQALRQALIKSADTETSLAHEGMGLRELLQAILKRSTRPLLIVVDQFEEFVITTKSEQQRAFAAFIADLRSGPPMQNLRLLLVLRSEYEAFLEDAGLPLPRNGEDLFVLARFQLSDAAEFMKKSPLSLHADSLERLLDSAAKMDETPGLVRPITLNVIGFVLSGRASAPSLDAGILVRRYIEQTVTQPAIRYFAPKILEQMITEQGTKMPCSELELVEKTKLRRGEVRAVLNSMSIAALARQLDVEGAVWELSHDFIARAVARFLGRLRFEAFEQVGVYAAPALLTISILGGLWLAQPYVLDRINWLFVMRPYVDSYVRPFVLNAERERALTAGASFRECKENCPEMVVLPLGRFLMGSAGSEEHRHKNEGPQHEVSIKEPFAISKFDVTFADWDACVSVGACPKVIDSGFGRGTRPVINVTWDEAQQYVKWLSLTTGRTYRLPTEAEWEYASRGGRQSAYPWGDHFKTGKANCHGCNSKWDDSETSPVGSFEPNVF